MHVLIVVLRMLFALYFVTKEYIMWRRLVRHHVVALITIVHDLSNCVTCSDGHTHNDISIMPIEEVILMP